MMPALLQVSLLYLSCSNQILILFDFLSEQAYDNAEIAVRKATVFCMVAIYGAVGEVMNSYLNSLSAIKMKLLKLYIDRSIQTNGKS